MDRIERDQRIEWGKQYKKWQDRGKQGPPPVRTWEVNNLPPVSPPQPVLTSLLATTLVPASTTQTAPLTSIALKPTVNTEILEGSERNCSMSYADVHSEASKVIEGRREMFGLTPNPLVDLIDMVKEQIGQLGKTPLEAFCEKTGKAFDVELKEKAVDEGMEVVIREDRKEEIGTAFNLFYSTLINLISDGFSFKFNGQEISDYDTIRNMLMNTMEPISEQDPRSKSFVMLDNCLSLLVPLIKSKLLHQSLSDQLPQPSTDVAPERSAINFKISKQ